MQSKVISSTSILTSTPSHDIAINVKNLTKIYKLYKSPQDRLKEALNPFRKRYHKPFYALKNVSFEVKKGEILGIVGKNGAGKSTLLEIITGVLSPTSGTVITEGKISALLSLGIGFNPELTGIENIHFNGALQGYSKKELDLKIKDILDFAEIGDFAYQPIKTYSSGMQARLGFAVSINIDPEILIVDEALAVGDELFKRKCYARLEQIMKAGKTVLFVTHSIGIITQLCTRAIFIEKGKLILEGSPKLVTSYYKKYLFANKNEKELLLNEIDELNNDEKNKANYNLKTDDEAKINRESMQNKLEANTSNQKPFFIPNYKLKSTSVLKNWDMDLFDMQITTLDGEQVNSLVTNEEYIYSYKVEFGVDTENINFGMGIKNKMGTSLTWMIYPGVNKYFQQKFLKDQIVKICWKFKCVLITGTYFIDSGIRSSNGSEKFMLLKYNDAVVFDVQKNHNGQIGGIFYADQSCSMEIIKQ